MTDGRQTESLLCIVPPYRHRHCPPAGPAALLGHLQAAGIDEFRFLDLRLVTPDCYAPTFSPVGLFGESFVIDVPDLPLVLSVLRAFDEGRPTLAGGPRDDWFDRYGYERGLDPAALHAYLAGMDAFLEDAFRALPDLSFVGFSVWASNLTSTLMAAARLKRRRRPPFIVAGGPQVTESRASAELGLRSGLFDAVVVGEGEDALLDVYRAVRERRSVTGLPGVLTAETAPGEPVKRRPLPRLDTFADPALSSMNLAAYRAEDGFLRLPFQLSRGCTDRCNFCSEWVFWERYRVDSVEHAVDQLERLKTTYGVDRFHFTDSLINGSPRRLRAFAERLLERGLDVEWGGFMRAAMDDGTAKLLRSAGCSYAYVGVESFSDETLELMNKRRTGAENLAAIQSFLDAGITVSAGVIPGFPGDTRERFYRTVQSMTRIAEAHPRSFGFNVEPFYVSPNQPLFANLEEAGLTAFGWDDEILDLAPRYRDVTERVACRVEGRNQGMERLGQLRLLHLLAGRSPDADVFRHEEALPPDRMQVIRLGPARLALVKRRGRLCGLLLGEDERADLVRVVEGAGTGALFDRAEFRRLWDSVAARHAWPHPTPVLPACTVERFEEAAALTVPGHVVGRVVEHEGSQVLVVASTITLAWKALPPSLEPILKPMASGSRSRPWVEARLRDLAMPAEHARALFDAILADGLVDATEPAARPAPGDALADRFDGEASSGTRGGLWSATRAVRIQPMRSGPSSAART